MKKERFTVLALFCLLGALILSGCQNDTGTVEEIPDPEGIENETIHGIIVKGIPDGYAKVYINVSNSQLETAKHTAQGTKDIVPGEKAVFVELWEPIAGDDPAVWRGQDPDKHGANRWTGNAQYFSIVISKNPAPDVKSIKVWGTMAGVDLTAGHKRIDLRSGLIDLTNYEGGKKAKALYDDVVCKDNQGVGSDIITTSTP